LFKELESDEKAQLLDQLQKLLCPKDDVEHQLALFISQVFYQ